MAFWKRTKRQKAGIVSLFVQVLTWSTLVWMALLTITLGVTLHYSLTSMQDKIETNLLATSSALANSEMVRQSLYTGYCPVGLIGYLDLLIDNTEDLEVITIADEHSIRLYHVVRERIGQEFVGGDQNRALKGETYLSDAVGTLGLQRRAFSSVVDDDGTTIGFVMVSTTMSRLNDLRSSIAQTYIKMAGALMLASLVLSGVLSFFVFRMLHGFGPEELVHTYLTQNDILNNLDEGLVSIDSGGNIQLVNGAAEKMLGQQAELLHGVAIDSILGTKGGDSLLPAAPENTMTSRPNILATCVPLEKDGKWTGSTLILKDKSDAIRRAEQLNGTRHIVSALRANSHDYLNKLQVISGLLQMDRPEDAKSYIGAISVVHAKAIGPVLSHIHNPNVAALLLGKLNNMRELDIQPTLLVNSHLPEHSLYLSTAELVTVMGNLLENAIEAVNMPRSGEDRSIVFQMTEDTSGLLLMVSDTGTGITPAVLSHIYDINFSTKATEGRGVGMSLIRDIIARHKGSIEVDSEPGAGTSFTLIFSEKRQRT